MQSDFRKKKEELAHQKAMLESDLEKNRKEKDYLITKQHQVQAEYEEKKHKEENLIKELKTMYLK